MLDRIEKSAFRKDEYVGYAGGVWNITKSNSSYGNWCARKREGNAPVLYAFTLAALDTKLNSFDESVTKITGDEV